jgi:hypothetical protein
MLRHLKQKLRLCELESALERHVFAPLQMITRSRSYRARKAGNRQFMYRASSSIIRCIYTVPQYKAAVDLFREAQR